MPEPISAIAAGSAVIGGVGSAISGKKAADAQSNAANAGISEERRQFAAAQKLLAPYVEAGEPALNAMLSITGQNGRTAQRNQVRAIKDQPIWQTMLSDAEESILQNSAATGGLRGGNTARSLMEVRPAILSQLLDQQYGRLSGLAQIGQSSATGTAAAGMQAGNNISGLLQQRGAAQAGGIQAIGAGFNSAVGGLASGISAGLGKAF